MNFNKDQTDYSISPSTLLLLFRILKSNNSEEINDAQVMDNLNTLIKNKAITEVSRNYYTNFVDGFVFTRNFFEENKVPLIIISATIVLVIILIWYWHKKYPKGNHIVIPKLILIITGFILDISFIINNGKVVPSLFVPSLTILVSSIVFNGISSILIIIKERSTNEEFDRWFRKNTGILAAFMSALSSADMNALSILSSRVAGLKSLYAPALYHRFFGAVW